MTIRIVGLKERASVSSGELLVDTTSKSPSAWTTDLSPFHLGPCALYDGTQSVTMENAWQFSKCYEDHVGLDGRPSAAYWAWARQGWDNPMAVRYPRGKGARPAFAWWAGQALGYVDARKAIYWPLYRDAVARTAGFARLKELHARGASLVLFDFDGFDHEARGMSLADVLLQTARPMGHAFVLKAMLLHGVGVRPEDLLNTAGPAQLSLL